MSQSPDLKHTARAAVAVIAAWLGLCPPPVAQAAPPAVLQRGYDASVSGANLAETTLTPALVTPSTFGLLFKLPVDDAVFAQPLYVPNLTLPGGTTHNVVYVATMSDSVYAFDADSAGAALWHVNLATLVGATPVVIKPFTYSNNKNIVGNLGILSTPVIDAATGIMYVVACTLESGTLAYRLHAIDITNGTEPYGPGVLITGSFGGSTFTPRQQVQRVSLVLSAGQVVIGFSAIELEYAGGYVGWMMAYDKTSLAQTGIFATVTTGNRGGGVWQSGRPPVVDSAGYVYVFTGNAYGGGYDGVNDFSESVLKLDPANGLALIDWFTPSDWATMDTNDADLSSSGPLLIPGTPAVIAGGGKTGNIYLLDSTNLGKNNPPATGDTQIIQKAFISASEFRGGPVYWQRSAANGGPLLYNWGVNDWPKAFAFSGQQLVIFPKTQGSVKQSQPGGILALSANGDQPGTGILWATVSTSGDPINNPPTAGELRALDASNLAAADLWNSGMNAARDGYGQFAKFVPPVVVNGKVYVATWSNQLAVYGLLSSFTLTPATVNFPLQSTNLASMPQVVTVTNTGSIALPITAITLAGANATQFSQTNDCGTSVAAGSACRVSIVYTPGTAGASQATLSVATSAGAGTQTINLNGSAAVPSFTLAPASVPFGAQSTAVASPAQQVMVTNTGTVPLSLTGITFSGANAGLYSQTNACAGVVLVGSSCALSVVFKPTAAGATAASLNVSAGGGIPAQSVALSGTGVVPTFTLSPAALAFGVQGLGVPSAAQPITLTNTSSVALPLTSLLIQGTNPTQFSQTNTCGGSVAAGAACTISVVFAPTAAGAAAATVYVNAAGGATAQSVILSGTGAVPVFTVSSGSVGFGVQSTTAASAPVLITLTNSGSLPVALTGIALTGSNADQFTQTNTCGATLAVGGSCTVSLIFRPTVAAAASATLNITAGGGAVSRTVALTGTGATPTFTVSPDPVAFGSQRVGTVSAAQQVTVTNSGSIAVPIAAITLGGANPGQFSQSGTCAASLAPGASCAVQVRFAPTVAGAQSGQLSVSSTPASHAVSLTGTGSILVTLQASAATTLAGTPVTLSWTATGASGCTPSGGGTGDGWSGNLAASGTRSVTESSGGSYNYGLTCSANGQSGSASVAVTVSAPSVTLSASTASASTGESFTLSWSSASASSCSASGGSSTDGWAGSKGLSGSASLSESSTGSFTYTLTCGTGSQSAHASATVRVDAPSSGSGGGALDAWSMLALLGVLAARLRPPRQRRGRAA